MAPIVSRFETEAPGKVSFSPHYLVWMCPDTYLGTPECNSQCLMNGERPRAHHRCGALLLVSHPSHVHTNPFHTSFYTQARTARRTRTTT